MGCPPCVRVVVAWPFFCSHFVADLYGIRESGAPFGFEGRRLAGFTECVGSLGEGIVSCDRMVMNWNIWDWDKRCAAMRKRKAQLSETEENLRRLNDRETVELEKAYRKLERTKSMMDVAEEALALQRERLPPISDQLKASMTSSMRA